MRGTRATGGVGLAEIYDLAPASSKLPNLSCRGLVQTGDNVIIGGVIIAGQPAQTLVRAIGPSLTDLGVAGALANPTLELFDGDGNSLTFNDDWKSDQEAESTATMLAPTDPQESAILATLPPAHYTAVVRGAGDTTGVGLVEFYNLE